LTFDVQGNVRGLVIAPLVLTVFSACAGDEGPEPGPDAVDVSVRQIYDMSEGGYIEGTYSYVRVERLDGNELIEKRFTQEAGKLDELRLLSTMTLRLDPGSYRLVSFQRPCSGNCENLDPPTDECSREIVVVRDRPVEATITVRPGEGCSVEAGQQ
jgi:hypothetical protein